MKLNKKKYKLPENIERELNNEYMRILNMTEDIEQSEGLTLSDARKKKGIGVKTARYGSLANSSGQDNLGQILLSVLSFQNLKEMMGDKYRGGILLIDEIDATLHPAAQNKLFDYLYKKSKDLDLQIVFTTHSLSLISHIIKKHELNDKNDSLVMLYVTNSRKSIEISRNPQEITVIHDLLNQYGALTRDTSIRVLTEDEEARTFLKEIIKYFQVNCNLQYHKCSISFENIIKLIAGDPELFCDYISVLDPDTITDQNQVIINKALKGTKFYFTEQENSFQFRVLCLPGKKRIESLIWEFIKTIQEDHVLFFDKSAQNAGITKRSLIDAQNNNDSKYTDEKQKHKAWFRSLDSYSSLLIQYWIKDHIDEAKDFLLQFLEVYNRIACNRKIMTVSFDETEFNKE